MKTPEEIKKGLEIHSNIYEECEGICPYTGSLGNGLCLNALIPDALAYIQHLEANQHKWRSPKAEPPDVDTFYAVTKFDPEIRVYKKNLVDRHYTTEWLNIRNDILYWMPIPSIPKGV